MPREANPAEVRTIRALRQVGAITGTQMTDAFTALEATETCTRCNGSGAEPGTPPGIAPQPCTKCDGTGQQRVIR